MIRDLLTGSDGDLVIVNGDLALVSDTDAIVQDAKAKLQTFLGEWFLDASIGVDWFGTILVKDPALDLVRAQIRNCLLGVEGITDVTDLQLDFDTAVRSLAIAWTAKSDLGVIEGSATVGG